MLINGDATIRKMREMRNAVVAALDAEIDAEICKKKQEWREWAMRIKKTIPELEKSLAYFKGLPPGSDTQKVICMLENSINNNKDLQLEIERDLQSF